MNVCPLCNGSREKLVVGIHSLTGRKVTRLEPCVCYISEVVSERCELLHTWSDMWFPEDKLDKRLFKFDPNKLNEAPSYILRGDYAALCLNVKGLMMKYWFREPRPLILFCRAIDILENFFVQQGDGTSPHLSDTIRYDVVVMCLDTLQKNDVLKTCVAQVAYIRNRSKKPTWMYLPEGRPTLSACEKEYSPELDSITASYDKIDIQPLDGMVVKPSLLNKADAANFKGLG